jgi:hypothetical protein
MVVRMPWETASVEDARNAKPAGQVETLIRMLDARAWRDPSLEAQVRADAAEVREILVRFLAAPGAVTALDLTTLNEVALRDNLPGREQLAAGRKAVASAARLASVVIGLRSTRASATVPRATALRAMSLRYAE